MDLFFLDGTMVLFGFFDFFQCFFFGNFVGLFWRSDIIGM